MESEEKFITIDTMHRTARGFLNTSEILCKDEYAFDYYPLYAPVFAVNLAFSCELSLKEILLLSNQSYDNLHSLDALFFSLPITIQKNIRTKYDASYQGENIENCLIKYRNAFIIWRYIHEQKGELFVPHDDLMAAANAIRFVAKELYENYANSLGKDVDYAD